MGGRPARSYTLDDINVVEVEMDALDKPSSMESPSTGQTPALVSSTDASFASMSNFDSVNNFGSGVNNFDSGVNNFGSGSGMAFNNYPAGPPPPVTPGSTDPLSSQVFNSVSVAGSAGVFVETGVGMSSSSSSSS